MKNLLKILTTLTLASTATMSVVACGTKDEASKKDLSGLLTKLSVDGKIVNTEEAVLNEIININIKEDEETGEKTGVTIDDVIIDKFEAAGILVDGSAIIKAKDESKYSGEVQVTIKALDKIDLDAVIKNKTLDGNKVTSEAQVIDSVLELNKDVEISKGELVVDSFVEASEIKEGSAIISATKEGKTFTGSVKITITEKDKIDLTKIITIKTLDGTNIKTANDVIKEIAVNNDIDNTQIVTQGFEAPTKNKDGKVTIVPATPSKYTGKVDITITKPESIELSSEITTIKFDGNNINSEAQLLTEIVLTTNLAKKDINIESFQAATKVVDGSATITAVEESRYTGSVNVTISKLESIDLSSIITTDKFDGNIIDTKDKLVNELITTTDLTRKDIEIESFEAATKGVNGSATITAVETSKYTGSVTVTLTEKENVNLEEVITIREVEGSQFNSKDSVYNAINVLNGGQLSLEDVVLEEFKEATTAEDGSMKIVALDVSKYYGEVDITIKKIEVPGEKTYLGDVLNTKEIDGNQFNNRNDILNEIVAQSELSINDIAISSFSQALMGVNGTVTISAIESSKYYGSVVIQITETTVSEELQELIDSIPDKEEDLNGYGQAYRDYLYTMMNMLKKTFEKQPMEISKDTLVPAKLSNLFLDFTRMIRVAHNENHGLPKQSANLVTTNISIDVEAGEIVIGTLSYYLYDKNENGEDTIIPNTHITEHDFRFKYTAV